MSQTDTAIEVIHVIKRNGSLQEYNVDRISAAIKKAFIAVEGDSISGSDRVESLVSKMVESIDAVIKQRTTNSNHIHIEEIQDQVELALMRKGEQSVARAYVLYRERQAQKRAAEKNKEDHFSIRTSTDAIHIDRNILNKWVAEACHGLADVQPDHIVEQCVQNLYDGVSIKEVQHALTLSARTMVEKEPNYTYVTARLLLKKIYAESLEFLNAEANDSKNIYKTSFKKYICRGVELDYLDKRLLDFNLETLAAALHQDRDLKFTYLSLQTLHDRYFIHHKDTRFELPQSFFMRVAMGLALNEGDKNNKAIEFYNLLSSFDFMSSTPTLFNSGTIRPQLSSCFLSTIDDDLKSIYGAFTENALLSKFAGGLGNDWTRVRAMGSHIKGTNGKSLGVIPFMNVADATAIAVNQGGKRKGAVCAYLETWHMDIEEFLDLRKNTGDDRRRTHDMNTANWIPDLFMKRVFENKNWTLFSPNDVPDLHETFGTEFEHRYVRYEELAQANKIMHRTIPAVKLWRKMLGMIFETGHPWITFKDPCNIRSPQSHIGVVHSSNLCTEITLNTSDSETAVCNLGSINLVNHMTKDGLDTKKLERTIKTAVRMLDNVIDINYYSVEKARHSNLLHRPVGIGLMGFHDALYLQDICYASDQAIEFADKSMELISYYAISASIDLARERGTYASYEGSLWSQGILPIDSIARLKNYRQEYLAQNDETNLDWSAVRTNLKKYGMRNSNVMAIAPTATISNICGISQSIEPTFQNIFVKSNLSGEFTVTNPYLINDLKALGLWDDVMIHDLKFHDGSIDKIDRIPQNIKAKYATAFEIEPKWLIEAASRRQKWLDQAQSLNLYIAQPSGKKLDIMYRMAWLRGLKTTYYLRSMGASRSEKSTVSDSALNAVKACNIDNPDCEACQ
jgi:ribonucleoside-diphosphate reductase alpha chain